MPRSILRRIIHAIGAVEALHGGCPVGEMINLPFRVREKATGLKENDALSEQIVGIQITLQTPRRSLLPKRMPKRPSKTKQKDSVTHSNLPTFPCT